MCAVLPSWQSGSRSKAAGADTGQRQAGALELGAAGGQGGGRMNIRTCKSFHVCCIAFMAEWIAIGPRYFVAQLRVSFPLIPAARAPAHGCPLGDYTPGRYAWKLANVQKLPEPIPAKGRQGLWNWEALLLRHKGRDSFTCSYIHVFASLPCPCVTLRHEYDRLVLVPSPPPSSWTVSG